MYNLLWNNVTVRSFSNGIKPNTVSLASSVKRNYSASGTQWDDASANAMLNQMFGTTNFEEIMKSGHKIPRAQKVPFRTVHHGVSMVDDYNYMTNLYTDKMSQEYMSNEDTHCRTMLQHQFAQYTTFFKREMAQQLAPSLPPTPEKYDNYYYYTKSAGSNNMAVYCRRKVGSNEEQILYDPNVLLKKHKSVDIATLKTTPDHSKLLLLFDTTHTERFSVLVVDSATGMEYPIEVQNVVNAEWHPDGKSFYYTSMDSKNRPYRITHHVIGTAVESDKIIFEEEDDQFFVDIGRTKDWKFLTINSNSKKNSELRYFDPHSKAAPTLVMSKSAGSEFFLDHASDGFYMVTADINDANYKVLRCKDNEISNKKLWTTVVPSDPDVKLDDMDVFDGKLVIYERKSGQVQIRVVDTRTMESKYVPLPSGLCNVEPGSNLDPKSESFRFTYSTPLIAPIVYDYHFATGKLEIQTETKVGVLPNAKRQYNPDDYTLRQVMVPSVGGVSVPMTLVHRKDISPSSENPTYLTVYGAYGHSLGLSFDAEVMPLLQRGWVLAFPHVRGGGELGLRWYQSGRQLHKKNTFTDLYNCINWLFTERLTSPAFLVGRGSSAGGLPLAVMANQYPGLFRCLILRAPFLDVLNTMLDESLPLTVHEYDEWGNPREKEVFNYIHSYDPYWNIRHQEYPAMLITSSVADQRVPSWNHCRYVAKLRENKTDDNMVLLRLDSKFGHFGSNGSERITECAEEISFIHSALDLIPARL